MLQPPAWAGLPHRFSGVVYGTLLNDPATLAALGDAVHQPPYRAPPAAPVLYLKPRHTQAPSGATVDVPAAGTLEIGATLGLVIGRTACRVPRAQALDHVAGCILVADLCIPHTACYRPSVRLRARDGSCLLGPVFASRATVPEPDRVELTVRVDHEVVQRVRFHGMQRGAARLLQDITAFMTLRPGDLLLMGLADGAPQAGAGQCFSIEAPGLGNLTGQLRGEHAPAAEVAP